MEAVTAPHPGIRTDYSIDIVPYCFPLVNRNLYFSQKLLYEDSDYSIWISFDRKISALLEIAMPGRQ
jgi:hypothetical protein